MKKIIIWMMVCIACLIPCVPVSAQDAGNSGPQNQRLVDEADLMTSAEEARVMEKLDEISVRQAFDVVVVTVNSTGQKTPQEFADDFYDAYGYGYGPEKDGVLLLVNMGEREWHISTTGYGITALTDAGIEAISEQFLPYLSDGDYEEAFLTFADTCDEFVTQAKEGNIYDRESRAKRKFNPFWIPAALIVAFLLSGIPLRSMKNKLNNVHAKPEASDYIKNGDVHITDRRDIFLYHTVTRVPRPKEKSSGGSSIHMGSSGASHGGGGGKF